MQKDEDKAKYQPIDELVELRQRINLLGKSENPRKLEVNELGEGEKKFRELAELLSEMVFELATKEFYIRQMVFETDKEGNITFANQLALDTFGYTQEDFDKGLNALQMLIPEDRDRVMENIQRKLRGEELDITEYIAQRKDGSRFPIILHSSIITDEEGNPVGLRGIAVNITERKRAEEALRKSEERFLQMAEVMPAVFWMVSRDWKKVHYVSPAFERIYGRPCQELLDNPNLWIEVIHEEDRNRVLLSMEKLHGTEFSLEYRIVRPDGAIRWILDHTVPIYDKKENLVLLTGFVSNITEQKKVEEELRESEEKLKNIFSSSPDAITVTDLSGNIVECNQKTLDMHEYSSKEELIGKNAFELIAERDHKRAKENMEETLKQGSVKNIEYTFLTKNGREFPAELSASVIKDFSGNLVGLVAVTKDITERKKAEEELQRSEQQYRTTIDSVSDPIHVVDKDLRIILFNKTFKQQAEKLGLKTEVIGQKLFEVFPFLPDKVRDEYLQVFNTGKPLITEEHIEIGGREYITETRKIPVFEGKKVARVVTIIFDITEHKRTEKALRQRAEELERSKAELQQSLQELLERVEREYGNLVTRPMPEIDVEERGAIFLYPADREEEIYALFRSKKDVNRPALVITRSFPPRFQRKFGREVETIWLTSNRVPGMVCVDPSDTMNLLLVFSEFLKRAPEGVILFEGVEYAINIAGFKRFLQIVQLLNDKIAMTDGTIYMILDLQVLEEKEARHIMRECLPPLKDFGAK